MPLTHPCARTADESAVHPAGAPAVHLGGDLDEDGVRELVAGRALTPSGTGVVGLELERHVVDVTTPARRVPWDRLTGALAGFVPPGGSTLTLEPGGQVELSGPPGDVVTAVRTLERDAAAVDELLAADGLALNSCGLDPLRPPQRVNPASRYRAMGAHFDAVGHHDDGATMMCSTASLQLNLDAGPATGWVDRLAHVRRLRPLLTALAASSPLARGVRTGAVCGRQGVWQRLEPGRCRTPEGGADPAAQWAEFALQAPVMFVRSRRTQEFDPVAGVVPFRDWAAGRVRLDDRGPTTQDVEAHLSTLWPPVRLRGFLELRFLDAVPRRFRPGLVALAVTAIDDPLVRDRAAQIAEPVADAELRAAHDGLADPALRRAAADLLDVVTPRVPAALRRELEPWSELLEAGRSVADLVLDRFATSGPTDCLLAEDFR